MIVNLFIVRHGHSPFHSGDDFSRPLSTMGIKQAEISGRFIAQHLNTESVHIVASPASRTTMTAQALASSLPNASQIRTDEKLYAASVGDWCRCIEEANRPQLVLVGHNPTLSQLCQYLSQEAIPGFTPATTAHFQLELTADGLTIPATLKNIFRPE